MNDENGSVRRVARLALALASLLALGALGPAGASAQVPPRFYWKTLSGANAVPLIVNSISGNTNPFDPSHLVTPGANVDATLALPGYARTFSLGGRAALFAVIAPMGRISGEVTAGGGTVRETARGFGDPMLELNVNLIGPPAQKNLVDALRYEPGFSLDVIADLAVPVGEYDNTRTLNLGQNRWYGRVGAPIVWQLGPWVPGRRTTLELLPAVWFFGTNDDFVGQTLSTDPMFEVAAQPDAGLHRAPLGVARRRLVHGRQGDDRRRRGREARQPGNRTHPRVPDQRQPGTHRGLQVDHQRRRSRRPPDGRVHGLAGGGLAPARRGRATAEGREVGTTQRRPGTRAGLGGGWLGVRGSRPS